MIDPMVSLAFAVYSNKGTYALLLGSGVSRASGIPTGWEVVLDLLRKVAKLEGEDCESDPATWFRNKHRVEPDYSKLLDAIAKTPTERQQMLRAYFEPTDEERGQGLKLPSVAHRAIARLVAAGYLRVIITTNFDRLTEMALEELGVAPTIISTIDQLAGALPLAHSGATIIKLHGDYRDTRIKNTEAELAAYDEALNKLLDRILDEYGLIVSGWSADWDIALRAAVERCQSRRFTTFWASRSELSVAAKTLATHRQAVVFQTKDANQLFEAMEEKVRTLGDMAAPHPLSAKMAVATVKRYLVDPSSKIRLRDLLHEEIEKITTALTEKSFPGTASQDHPKELLTRVLYYNSLTEILLSVVATGTYWGESQHVALWTGMLQRIVNATGRGDGLVHLAKLRRYPALLLFYAAGLGAVASRNYGTLAALFLRPQATVDGKNLPLVSALHTFAVMENDIGHMLPGMERHHTPLSDYLFAELRSPLREYLPSDEEYQLVFDKFEYLLGLTHADLGRHELENGWWGPIGCFSWRGRHTGNSSLPKLMRKELELEGGAWGPIQGGLFHGSAEEATIAMSKFHAHLARIPFY